MGTTPIFLWSEEEILRNNGRILAEVHPLFYSVERDRKEYSRERDRKKNISTKMDVKNGEIGENSRKGLIVKRM